MDASIAALEAAFNNTDQPDTRKTFGNVTYALIPVAVIEAVLDNVSLDTFIPEVFEEPVATEAEEPTTFIDDLLADPTSNVEIREPTAAIVAREVAVVETPFDPRAAFPPDSGVEVAVPSDQDFDPEGLDGSFGAGDFGEGNEEE